MSSDPLVSVVIPCYNYGRFLSEALESILAQTYTSWECIIVDDGSTDNTKEIAHQYTSGDSRFQYIYQKNQGLAGARNAALKQSKGEYIQFLDADDMLERDKLALQVPIFKTNHHIDLVFSNILSFKHNVHPRIFNPFIMEAVPVSGKGEVIMNNLVVDNSFLPGCVILKRELYNRVGFFRSGMGGLEDWNYWFRAALLGAEFYNDTREGTHLLARNHGHNMSSFLRSMLHSKIAARKDIMNFTNELQKQRKLMMSPSCLKRLEKMHIALLNRDKARLNLFYGNLAEGCVNALKHAYYSGRPYFAFYDGAYWIKERVKRKYSSKRQ